MTKTERFAAWLVVSGDATADEIRVVWSVLGAISCHQLPTPKPNEQILQAKFDSVYTPYTKCVLYEICFDLKRSGNEVYYTILSMLPVKDHAV